MSSRVAKTKHAAGRWEDVFLDLAAGAEVSLEAHNCGDALAAQSTYSERAPVTIQAIKDGILSLWALR